MKRVLLLSTLIFLCPAGALAQVSIRIAPVDRATLAAGQRFDLLVEAEAPRGAPLPVLTQISVDGEDVTARNQAAPSSGAPGVARFLLRDLTFETPGQHTVTARTAAGESASAAYEVFAWRGEGTPRVRNVILLLGDGMGVAHRTAARIVSRGYEHGKARRPLAMDTMEVTGQVMTASLNSVVTDSAPGMSALVTGNKSSNNQEGVYPDSTPDPFDNPRVEYLGALLRRMRGPGFRVGLVTTADVTDATPAANAVHTADRNAGPGIAARYFDERERNGIAVLMGGGSRHFIPEGPGSSRQDNRDLTREFQADGFRLLRSRDDLLALAGDGAPPEKLLGLFRPSHLPVAFDKIGAGRYSTELARERHSGLPEAPLLEEMTAAALRTLEAHAPAGFYLLVEGASIDKQAHAVDPERTVWDVIEFDRAVAVALDFARRTNGDADPANDTLVIVTADHETGGLGVIAVGNERYAPQTLGRAVRDYAAVFRFEPEQLLSFYPNYEPDSQGYPRDPDPSRKLLLGWAAAPDHYENWISNRHASDPAIVRPPETADRAPIAVANPARDGGDATSDNRTVHGQPIPGFLVAGTIENGASGCPAADGCPGDTAASALTISGHTGSDVPLSASGPGATIFTGTYDNTEVFRKILQLAGRP